MDAGFWTTGPVPLQLLDRLALPRPDAYRRATRALSETRITRVARTPGTGTTTFAHQIAAGWPHPTLFLDGESVLHADETEWMREILHSMGRRRTDDASWELIASRMDPRRPPLVVIDAPPSEDWVETMIWALPARFLLVEPGGRIKLEPIGPAPAREFLRQRTRTLGLLWTNGGLDEAVGLSEGQPDALQRIGQACLHLCLRERKDAIDEDTVLEATSELAYDLPQRIAAALAGLSPTRARLLKAIVRDPAGTPTEWSHHCGLDPKAATVHLKRLVEDDGLVTRIGRGAYRVSSPLVRMHVGTRYMAPVHIHPGHAKR